MLLSFSAFALVAGISLALRAAPLIWAKF